MGKIRKQVRKATVARLQDISQKYSKHEAYDIIQPDEDDYRWYHLSSLTKDYMLFSLSEAFLNTVEGI